MQETLFGQAGVGEVRNKNQAHYTGLKLARIVIAMLDERLPRAPDVFVEPSVGAGAFIIAARERWPGVRTIGVDIAEKAAGLARCDVAIVGDWLEASQTLRYAKLVGPGCLTVIAGNPPFRSKGDAVFKVIAHVNAARELAEHVALILPVHFCAGNSRFAPIMWDDNAPISVGTVHGRPWIVVREVGVYHWRERVPGDDSFIRVFPLTREDLKFL